MAKKKKIDIKQVIADALEHYHKMKPSIKDSTKRQNESLLSEFYRFVDTLPARDKTMKIFSQKGLNRYKEYLIDKMNSTKADGKNRKFGVGQINRCGSMIARLINKVLCSEEVVPNRVDWIKVEDPRREDQKGHFPLLDNEVTAIENCSGLTPVEEEYRDIFLLQIECGQRVSDLAKILTGKYKVKQGKKYEYIIISTIKENIKAHIPLRPKMRMWMEKVNSHKLIKPTVFEDRVNSKGNGTYNEAIRRIAKKAGLDREIARIDSVLTEVKGPLYEEITNHAARCTFITNMLKKGVSTERLRRITGHASDEMIRRIYAQLTDEDEINLIESDLYSDMDDDVGSSGDSSLKIPNEPEASVHKEATATHSIFTDSEPSSIFESDELVAYENYIRNLNDKVDEAINEINAVLQGYDVDELDNDELKSIIDGLVENKQQFKSKEDVINFWQSIEAKIKEDSDYPKIYIDYNRLDFLRTLIDYLRKKHVGEDAIESLEKTIHTICEENPDAFFMRHVMSHIKILWPIQKFYVVYLKMMQFIQENRPIADDTMFQDDNAPFKFITDRNLNMVFNELQKLPAMKLEALIQNINCGSDIKIVLLNSVKNGDFNSFYKTIRTHELNARILIRYAYGNLYLKTAIKLQDHLFKIAQSGPENPIEIINRSNELLLLNHQYVDNGNSDAIPDFLKTDIQQADYKEQLLWVLDTSLKSFDKCYRYAYPSEKKIFDKVRSLVDFNKYPELKDAYDEYLAMQKAVSNQTDVEATIASEEDKREKRKNDCSRVNYLPVSIQNLVIDKFIRLLTEKDEINKFQPFITVLESTDNVNVATCLKHFLGTTSTTPLSFKLKWNGNSMVSLKFLIRLIVNTNEDATRENVIEKNNKKAFDGISKKVSKWKGSGDLWTPVYNVFEGCTSSILTASLGDEGTGPRKINLEQLETIADIYFSCKKKCDTHTV